MEECPVCFDPMKKMYQLDNCSHKMCISCAKQIKKRSEETCVKFNSEFLNYYNHASPIKCPLCRKLEKQWTVDDFKQNDPENYNEWIQLELHCDEWGSSFYYTKEKYVEKSVPKYNRIPKRVTWKIQHKTFK